MSRRPGEWEKLVLSLLAIAAAGVVWGLAAALGLRISFLAFAVLTLALYFVILTLWRRRR